MFSQVFKLSSKEQAPQSVLGQLANEDIPAGVYNHGLLIAVAANDDKITLGLSAWRWLIPEDAQLICYSAFGDYFYWSDARKSVYFVNCQYGTEEFVDREVNWVANNFLTIDEIAKLVLKEPMLGETRPMKGDLEYGQCYILEPWLMLGGSESPERFNQGSFAVYTDLVGQAHQSAAGAS